MWTLSELKEFYSLLEFFGTDFSMMAHYLKTKSLIQIKVNLIDLILIHRGKFESLDKKTHKYF